MPKTVGLLQDRTLIRSNFDGYKLSLDPIPLISQELAARPHKAEASEDQYALLHAELFTMQNLLLVDPWERNTAYFINCFGEIIRSAYEINSGRPRPLEVVCRLPDSVHQRRNVKGDYNYSMRFISEKYCVLCNGINQLLLFNTEDRLKAGEWKQLATTEIRTEFEEEINFTIYDCRLDIIKEQKQISCALGHVRRVDKPTGASSIHVLRLHLARWLLDMESDTWNFSIVNTLEGKGSLYYCAFEPRAEAVVVCSNREFHICSGVKVEEPTVDEAQELVQSVQLHDKSAEVSGFTWLQSDDDVVIKFDIREGKTKANYSVQCTSKKLTVKCDECLLLDNGLYEAVDQDLTTWTIENNYLQITLIKAASSLRWPTLLSEGICPKETVGGGGQSGTEQKPVANLETPVEDCDFPMGDTEDNTIVRFKISTGEKTHCAFLGNSPLLFSTLLRPGFPAAFATRQNVDAALWLQQYNPSNPDDWSLRHEGNLHAFAYVQASKQERKFTDCSPDLSYAVICETHRHIFLYKSDHDNANGLRNRSGHQVTVGKQYLLTLESYGEVLGIATAPNVVTLLTDKSMLYLQIN